MSRYLIPWAGGAGVAADAGKWAEVATGAEKATAVAADAGHAPPTEVGATAEAPGATTAGAPKIAESGGRSAVRPGVKPGEVDTYGNLKSRELPNDRLDIDHQPSHASNVLRRQQELGRPLTKAEATEVRNQGTAVAVPEEVHAAQPTTGSANRPLKVSDAADPVGAAMRDSKAMIENTKKIAPHLVKQIESAASEIVQRIKDGFGL